MEGVCHAIIKTPEIKHMPEEMPVDRENADVLRVLPDPEICRTIPIGQIRLFARCCVDKPFNCPHVAWFAESYFCKHPNWEEFVKARTPESKQN